MNRSASVLISLALLGGLTACDDTKEYTEVCVNAANVRVDDSNCESHRPFHSYYFYPVTTLLPAFGYRVPPGYSRSLPSGYTLSRSRPPATGGQVAQTRAQRQQAKQQQHHQQMQQPQYKQYKPPPAAPRPAPKPPPPAAKR